MTKKIIAIIALAAASATSAFAQNSGTQVPNPGATEGSGLLGKRFAALGFVYSDIKKSSVDLFAGGAAVNLPINANIDVGLSATHAWVESRSDIDAQSLDASATYYFSQGVLKPFGTVTLGHSWFENDNAVTWGVSGGVEYAHDAKHSFDASVAYNDDFETGNNSQWSGTLGGNRWFTSAIAARFTVSLIEEGHVQYAIAGIFRF
jgi:hypothetical protein